MGLTIIKFNMNEFSIDSFLEGLEIDKTSTTSRGPSERIVKIMMNTRDNQGTVVFVPFMNKKSKNFYFKVGGVREWNGPTTVIDSGKVWYKILPEEYYGELSPENKDLLTEIYGLYDHIDSLGKLSYDEIRSRNYTLIYGVLVSHTKTDKTELKDNIDRPCLFMFPSHSVITAISTAINAKCQALKGSKNWIPGILNPNNKGRDGVISISFNKSKGPGYETTVGFEFNSTYSILVDPERTFSEEEFTRFFDDPLRDLMGWLGEGTGYFNVQIMKELRDGLKIRLSELTSKPTEEIKYENKNGSQDPMKTDSTAPIEVVSTPAIDQDSVKENDLPF